MAEWHILLVEDDPTTLNLVTKSLGKEFSFTCCGSVREAEMALEKLTVVSVALIDRGLPDGDGLRVCDLIRNHPRVGTIPILFLTGRETESDKLSGFFAGADDYITKPFSPLELRARIMARLRVMQSPTISIGHLQLDLKAHRVCLKAAGQVNKDIELTRIEFKLLVTLAQAPDRVLSRDFLLTAVWGSNFQISDRVVDSHLSHLRKKIEGAGLRIESLRGEGYRLKSEAAQKAA